MLGKARKSDKKYTQNHSLQYVYIYILWVTFDGVSANAACIHGGPSNRTANTGNDDPHAVLKEDELMTYTEPLEKQRFFTKLLYSLSFLAGGELGQQDILSLLLCFRHKLLRTFKNYELTNIFA
ncbi:hypothetical protein TcasGA2_TC033190 [Tribolium castaneum]|uniref:Uncharacterized protein n=1 Tax=Tribolium castaneum TaxID=7070 RepID=A0A139WH70_TRICA|nr:hypothetical protein TcasGA2_TC033190 [Tribolium castaneum]